MKYVKFGLIVIAVLLLSGCTNSTVGFVHKNDFEGLQKYHQTGGSLYENTNATPLAIAVYYSGYYLSKQQQDENYKIIKYLLENGADVKNNRYIGFDSFNMSLLSYDHRVVKILMDHNVPIKNFAIPDLRTSIDKAFGKEGDTDQGTICGFKQYICDNQAFAKQYYQELQVKKKQLKEEKFNEQKNTDIDNLLGI